MTKEKLREIIYKIADMAKTDLESYRNVVATSDVNTKAKGFIMRAIDIRLNPIPIEQSLVENGENKNGEIQ